MDIQMAMGEAISRRTDRKRVSTYNRPIFTNTPEPPTMANFINSSTFPGSIFNRCKIFTKTTIYE
jgi:hypothetical protein